MRWRPLRGAAQRALDRFLPGYAYRLRQWNWERNWSRPDYVPAWRITMVPPEIREAVDQGWFPPGSSLLDIGCGSGEIAAWLAERGFDVLGVDYSRSAIAKAQAIYRDAPGRLELKTADICQASPAQARFNALLDRGCFHVIPRAFAADYVRNVAAAALPGARFLLLFATTKYPGVETGDPARTKQAGRRYIETMFRPAFDIVRSADTTFEKKAGDAPESPALGVAFWMIRR